MPASSFPARAALALLASLAALWPRGALGGEPAPSATGDAAAAQALFDEGQKLLTAGDFKAACPKLAESYRLDPALGTLLNLATCHAGEGKIATAWSEFKEGSAKARSAGNEKYEKWAADRALALEPRLPRLAIKLARPTPGVEITRDGVAFSGASLGVALPVDPGWHEIVARAPGHLKWSTRVETPEGKRVEVEVPRLRRAATGVDPNARWNDDTPDFDERPPAASGTDPAPDEKEGGLSGAQAAGLAVTGAGVAALVAGAVFVKLLVDQKEIADEHCPDMRCDATGAEAVASAKGHAWGANIGFGLGVVGVIAGGYLLFQSDDAPSPPTSGGATRRRAGVFVSPEVGPKGGMLRGGVRF